MQIMFDLPYRPSFQTRNDVLVAEAIREAFPMGGIGRKYLASLRDKTDGAYRKITNIVSRKIHTYLGPRGFTDAQIDVLTFASYGGISVRSAIPPAMRVYLDGQLFGTSSASKEEISEALEELVTDSHVIERDGRFRPTRKLDELLVA